MTLAYWFLSMPHARRLSRTGFRRIRSRAFHCRASFEALEDRRLLSATVSFTQDSESDGASTDKFNIPVTLSDNVTAIGFDWPGPVGLATDKAGDLFVMQSDDAGTVSEVPAGSTTPITFATGFKPLDEVAGDLAFGPNGNLYVANTGANAVNEVTPQGKISTFVSGLNDPVGLAFDPAGNLYVSQPKDNTVSKVTPQQNISTFASGPELDQPEGLACDSSGNIYVANGSGGTVLELSSAGHAVEVDSGFDSPDALAFDSSGDLYVTDSGFGTINEVLSPESFSQVAGGFTDPDGLAFDPSGNLYVADYGGSETLGAVSKYSGPVSVPFTLAGNATVGVDYLLDSPDPLTFPIGQTNASIYGELDSDPGPSHTLTFTLGSPTNGAVLGSPSFNTLTIAEPPTVQFSAGSETDNEAEGTFSIPVTLSAAVEGTVTVPFTLGGTAASGTAFSAVTTTSLTFAPGTTTEDITGTLLSDPGPSQTLTLTLGTPTGDAALGSPSVNTLTITEPGRVQFSTESETVNESAGTFSIPVTLSATPTVSNVAAGFNQPDGLAVDSAGNLYIASIGDGTVTKVTPAGMRSTFAFGLENPGGLAFDAAGNLYIADSIDNSVMMVTPQGLMSTFATGLDTPFGLAFDSAGNLYVSNVGDNTVVELSPTGLPIATISGFSSPSALAFDSAGNLYVANFGDGKVSEVPVGGTTPTTFASGLTGLTGLAVDSAGNLYVTNNADGKVSEVPTGGGTSTTFASGFNGPYILAFAAGVIYVANNGDNTVSELSETVTVPFSMLGGSAAAGTAFSGVSAGPLTFGIGRTTLDITGRLVADTGPSQTLTFSLGTPTGDAALGSPSLNTLIVTEPAAATPTSTPTSEPPVFIGEQRVFSGKGKHKKLVGFEFLFNGALNAGGAQSTRNYHVTQKSGKKAKVLRVKSALYNPSNFSVAISVAGFSTSKTTQVTIAGLEGADGTAIPEFVSRL
jgi:sugar lactone lactonase YvrE